MVVLRSLLADWGPRLYSISGSVLSRGAGRCIVEVEGPLFMD